MITEIVPVSISGSLGAVVQNMITFAFVIAYGLGFYVPYEYTKDGKFNEEIYTSNIWRYIFFIPGIVAVMQIFFVVTIFRDDTPKYYELNNNPEMARRVYSKIYIEQAPNEQFLSPSINAEESPQTDSISFFQIFGKRYRYALFLGIIIFTLAKLTGINAFLFYSIEIFTQNYTGYAAEREARIGTMLVGITLFGTSFLSSILLARIGRKAIMIIGHIGILATLIALAMCAMYEINLWSKIFTVAFVFFYGTTVGTIIWVYNAEILEKTSMSFATFWDWVLTILFTLFTNQGFELLKPEGMYFLF